VPSGRAALIFATFPLLTMLVAAALGAERLTLSKALGVLLTLGGVGCALGDAGLGRLPGPSRRRRGILQRGAPVHDRRLAGRCLHRRRQWRGYCLWRWALDHAPPTEVTVFLALSPVTATVLGATLLGEAVSPIVGVGVALVAAGIWLATRATTRPRAVG
jgi:drug/metabolite transporter (DMT)-like permease